MQLPGFPIPAVCFPPYMPIPPAPQVIYPHPQSGTFPWNPYMSFPFPHFGGFMPPLGIPPGYPLGHLPARVSPMSLGGPIPKSVPLQATSEIAIPPSLQSSASITELSQVRRTPSPSPTSLPTPVMLQPQATEFIQEDMPLDEPASEQAVEAIIPNEDQLPASDEIQPAYALGMEDSTGRPTPEEIAALEREIESLIAMSAEEDKETESKIKGMPLRTPFKSRRTRLQWEGVRSDAVKSALKRHRNVELSSVVQKQFQCTVCQAKGTEQFYAHKASLTKHVRKKHL